MLIAIAVILSCGKGPMNEEDVFPRCLCLRVCAQSHQIEACRDVN